MLYKKAVLKYFAIFTGKHLCWSPFYIHTYIHTYINTYIHTYILYFLDVNKERSIINESLNVKKTKFHFFHKPSKTDNIPLSVTTFKY